MGVVFLRDTIGDLPNLDVREQRVVEEARTALLANIVLFNGTESRGWEREETPGKQHILCLTGATRARHCVGWREH